MMHYISGSDFSGIDEFANIFNLNKLVPPPPNPNLVIQ